VDAGGEGSLVQAQELAQSRPLVREDTIEARTIVLP
jgi:hypothetical protein